MVVESTYAGEITYDEPNIQIVVNPEFDIGSYEINFSIVVEAVGWSQDYTVEF